MRDVIHTIYDILDRTSPKEIRFLKETDPFRFLCQVVLSAQTTDEAVNEVSKQLFTLFPDRHSLAVADPADVERVIHRLGFFRAKAKHLIALANALDGEDIPRDISGLCALPGVGRKTANCYLGDIMGQPAVIVDTHFARVVRRLGLVDSTDPTIVEREIRSVLEPEKWYRFSMTANLFGRTVCHAKRPSCDTCPLATLCPSKDAVRNVPST
ncbi:MAG: endonuclease III [Sphaerochaeta sp.]|jgi:endonuclease-3|nr:endonuclease III [Sphaerochaeta sp.]MCH3920504.1 endonuclease III [Sphaerochaeta sp.]MCI2044982.1 endonuclease III [Sphaerochaeta sp.]MCI2076353.1 endonuclease III [Sphaerochaeta sp.]MCI2096906.1 endonuclease III [Sphaerochaeta sp.]